MCLLETRPLKEQNNKIFINQGKGRVGCVRKNENLDNIYCMTLSHVLQIHCATEFRHDFFLHKVSRLKIPTWYWCCKPLSYADALLPIFLGRPPISDTRAQSKMDKMWRLLHARNNATISVLQNPSQSPLSPHKLKGRTTLNTRETQDNDPGTLPSIPKSADKEKLAAGLHRPQTILNRHRTTPPAKLTGTQH